jgi:hypothetical protein
MFAAQGLPGELQSLAPKVATLTARLIGARTRLRHVLQVGERGAAACVNRASDGPSPVANAKHSSLPEYVAQPRTKSARARPSWTAPLSAETPASLVGSGYVPFESVALTPATPDVQAR